MFDFLFKKSSASDNKLFYHTDIHSHMMPGVDHGAQSVDDSLRLIKNQIELGISNFVFTPHVTEVSFENNPETLAASFSTLSEALNEEGLDIRSAYSAEYRIDQLFRDQFKDGKLVAMPGGRLLIENAYMQEPWGLDQLIFDLLLKGFRPIMAHPERFSYYYENSKRLKDLHDAGAEFQINLLSLAGYHGKDARRQAERIIDADLADYLGSDVHHDKHIEVIREYVASSQWRRIARRLEGRILNDQVFEK